jgi:hypothetical protein
MGSETHNWHPHQTNHDKSEYKFSFIHFLLLPFFFSQHPRWGAILIFQGTKPFQFCYQDCHFVSHVEVSNRSFSPVLAAVCLLSLLSPIKKTFIIGHLRANSVLCFRDEKRRPPLHPIANAFPKRKGCAEFQGLGTRE